MATLTSTILGILAQKDAAIITGVEAVSQLLTELQKQIVAELVTMPAESYASLHLRQTLRSIEGHIAIWQRDAAREVTTALDKAWQSGAAFVPQVMQQAGAVRVMVDPLGGIGHISSNLLDTLKDFTVKKLGEGVGADLQRRIQGEISLGILGQRSPGQIVDALLRNGLEGYTITTPTSSIFISAQQRAETIVQTEMGRAHSMATSLGIEQAAEALPQMEKMWVHAGHPKQARISHVAAHGQHVPANGKFLIGSVALKYPRDPAGGAAHSVRCGCDVVPYMPEWYTPQQFLGDWEKHRERLMKRKEK